MSQQVNERMRRENQGEDYILTQRDTLKYLRAGFSSALSYELFAFIPIKAAFESPTPFLLKYAILKLAHIAYI